MCTDFLLHAIDGSVVNGRSLEFGGDMDSHVFVVGAGAVARGYSPHDVPGHPTGHQWEYAHRVVGLTAHDTDFLIDGMNSAGLSVGALWLPNITRYAAEVSNSERGIFVGQLAKLLLGCCVTIDHAKKLLSEVEVWAPAMLNQDVPLHFAVHDAEGRSIVIEFTDPSGKPAVYDNPVSVLTNEPEFPWHLENIGNFAGLQAEDVEPLTMGWKTFSPSGHGSGMRGLPGDSTPPSRFIRVVYQKRFASRSSNASAAANLALHLLNTVDIPLGVSASRPSEKNQKVAYDHTQWAVVKTLTSPGGERTYGIRTYQNPTLLTIDLNNIDPGPTEWLCPMPPEPAFIDITSKLRPRAA